MSTKTLQHIKSLSLKAAYIKTYPPLDQETRPAVPTENAAYYLSRRPQTLRAWACLGGPIRPIRINGRLAWRVADIKAVLNGEVV